MSNLVYIFLDIDGVLNSFQYIEHCYKVHNKPMGMDYTPFDKNCLNNFRILIKSLEYLGYTVEIILSSSWRLSNISKEIVGSRLSEYGLRISSTTTNNFNTRGEQIKDYLKDKTYHNIIILDDESFDITNYYLNNLVLINPVYGLTLFDVTKALNIIIGGNNMKWNDEMKGKSMTLNEAVDYVDQMYQERVSNVIEDGDTVHINKLDDVKFSNLEFAAVRLLREVQSLQTQLEASVSKDELKTVITQTSKYFNDPNVSVSDVKSDILTRLVNLTEEV